MDNTEVASLLSALQAGTMSLEQVANAFRSHPWKSTAHHPTPTNYLSAVSATLNDPEPTPSGSWDEVAAAYHRGDLTEEQYEVLARAMTGTSTT